MSRNKRLVPQADAAMDKFKYEVADELGILDKVTEKGWGEMTTREVGRVGGQMVRKMIKAAEESLTETEAANTRTTYRDELERPNSDQ